jgi:hypothetical protein
VRIVDPYASLQSPTNREHAVRASMQSNAAEYIRFKIAEHLADVEDHDDLDEPFTRGYRMALRVAFIAAGGEVDGSEEQWAEVVEAGRG